MSLSTSALILLGAGLVMLVLGAELLIRGASRLAAVIGISPLVIGLTVVAFGTSSPELAISLQAAHSGQGGLAVGNVVGSNIFNVLFILGVSALIAPLTTPGRLLSLDVPIMIGASLMLLIFSLDGSLGWADGSVLFAGSVIYTAFVVRQSRKENARVKRDNSRAFATKEHGRGARLFVHLALVAIGLALLVTGARWLTAGAIAVATGLGVSQLIIGLTIVAVGTGLPEVAASVLAAARGERDIAVGNVVGSNIANILLVLGLPSLIAPSGIDVPAAAVNFDIPVMIAVAVACLPIFFIDGRISRWEGGLFLGYFAAYSLYLILDATRHDAQLAFSSVMMLFVIPPTVATLFILVVQQVRANRRAANRGEGRGNPSCGKFDDGTSVTDSSAPARRPGDRGRGRAANGGERIEEDS